MPRHQTLRALVDWSYELLFDDERRALAALSVFRNRFAMDDAEAVCIAVGLERGDVVDVVGRLVAKSLVTADRGSLEPAGHDPGLRHRAARRARARR